MEDFSVLAILLFSPSFFFLLTSLLLTSARCPDWLTFRPVELFRQQSARLERPPANRFVQRWRRLLRRRFRLSLAALSFLWEGKPFLLFL
jgi:hypothetical protein